jgi:hypothetical protein
VARLVVKLLNLTMSGPSISEQERVTREYWASDLSKNVEKLNINLPKMAELHASLLRNNMNVVKYVKQLQCHLADMEYKKNSSSKQ